MDQSWQRFQYLALRLFECLLPLYPARFHLEFSEEIQAIFVERMREATCRDGLAWLVTAFQEITGLVISIIQEWWHELRSPKEEEMADQDQFRNTGTGDVGRPALLAVSAPKPSWIAGWTLLTTAAIPIALIVMAPLAFIFMGLLNLGVKVGFWSDVNSSALAALGFITTYALVLASVQWYMLRKFLPRAGMWFIATVASVLIYGFIAGVVLTRLSAQNWDPLGIMAAVLLSLGLTLGLAHWLYLRRYLQHAFWIIIIDVLAFGSILLAGENYTSLAELAVFILPGVISGVGLWLLMRQADLEMQPRVGTVTSREGNRRIPRLAWIGLGVVALIPLFFACSWFYAVSQLALAKNEGVYPTPEEAVIAKNSQGWGGAEVVRIENVWVGPNSWDDSQPHVWFGTADVYMDRVPQGFDSDHYPSGSFFIHTQDGWVHVSEGAFPEFIGWVMELYNLEGVREWTAQK